MNNNTFFAFVSRMKNINRWALMRNTKEENLSQHSHEVACIAHAIAVISNKRLGTNYNAERIALMGLYHDTPEIITGDMPTPVKYHNPEIYEAFKNVENVAIDKLLHKLPEDLRSEYVDYFIQNEKDKELWKIVKAADRLSALIKCIEEEKAGNMEFCKAKISNYNSLKEMNIPAVDMFIEEFLPPYELTLDQLD